MAYTPTLAKATEFAGDIVLKIFTLTITTASDTIDMSSYFDTLYGVFAMPEAGVDADYQTIQVSFSGTTVTVASKQADGAAADEFTGTTCRIYAFGSQNLQSGS